MKTRRFALAALAALSAPGLILAQSASDLPASVDKQLPALTETYKHLHRAPELSHHEEKTSAFLAAELRKLGYTVTERIGRYEDGSQAYGIVAILQNGSGPRLLIRSDMDALPVEEKTGVDYASTVRSSNAQGQDVGVMHACGHDIHMTVLLGTARELAERKSQWHGTVMLIGQPSEEMIDGAKAMLADNLYQRFGRPDFVLSEHDSNDVAAGSVSLKGGPLLASSTGINVTIRGIGGHGSRPEVGKDPIVLAAEFILVAQTIVSRQIDPQQPAVLTVGFIHGGTKNNIIPDQVELGMTLRTYSQALRDTILADIRRTANGLAESYGIPADRMPVVKVLESTTATLNDAPLTERLRKSATAALGPDHVEEAKAVMGSEDVGLFTLDGTIPGVMFWLGAADPIKLAECRKTGVALPSPHSALFAPVYAPTIKTGVTAMTAMALDLLK
ncbi:amidohydrolase [Occallatibacter savannae]|uniref:amidohydrolase n=1 Tax=Occallatibacter savannae TaxID=1002691 RepID=UPI000D69BC4E|nr:amidohydrolase [Occallatibacter savannae]